MIRYEVALPLIVLAILGVGLVAVSSAATPADFQKQLMGIGLSLVPLVMLWFFGRERLYRFSFLMYGLAVLLLLATMVIGKDVNGSRNWLVIGPLQFQPLEVAKLALIISLAKVMKGGYQGLKSYFLPLALFLPVMGLVIKEDFGGAMVLSGIFAGMMLVYRIPIWHFLAVVVAVAIAFPTVVYPRLQPYQQQRLTIFINPMQDARNFGYQQVQGMIAIGSGGLMGKGYKQGTQTQNGFVPFAHTDFIFAAWAEEQGFVGGVFLLVLFGALFWRLSIMGSESPHLQDQLLFAGVLGQMGVQSLENIGAAMSLLPLTGITLPLVSYGLSSLISVITTLGMAYVIHRDRYNSI